MNAVMPIVLHEQSNLSLMSIRKIGAYTAMIFNNPELIAQVVAEKRKRAVIRENNFRRWG